MKELCDEHDLALRWLPSDMLAKFESLGMFQALQFLVDQGTIAACALLVKTNPFNAFVLCSWMKRTIGKEACQQLDCQEFDGDNKRKEMALVAYRDILTRLTRLKVLHLTLPAGDLTPEHFLASDKKRH